MTPFERLDRIHRKIRTIIWMQAVLLAMTAAALVLTFRIDDHLR